jgi:hypothetical protein
MQRAHQQQQLPSADSLLAAARRVPQLLSHLRTAPAPHTALGPAPVPSSALLRPSLSGLAPEGPHDRLLHDGFDQAQRNGLLVGRFMGVAAAASGTNVANRSYNVHTYIYTHFHSHTYTHIHAYKHTRKSRGAADDSDRPPDGPAAGPD